VCFGNWLDLQTKQHGGDIASLLGRQTQEKRPLHAANRLLAWVKWRLDVPCGGDEGRIGVLEEEGSHRM